MDFLKKLTSKKKSKQKSQPQQSQQPQQKLHEPNLDAPEPKGILKNKNDTAKYSNIDAYPTSDDIDESLRNAQKNSSLNQSIGNSLQNTQSVSPQNEQELKQNDNDKNNDKAKQKQKKFQWDEENLEKNEQEKVPRMKIDEPPTPYAEMPDELRGDYDEHEDVEEVILDENPMEMSLDDNYEPDLESNNNENNLNENKTLDQKQQALLLQDDEYRQKMVQDALNRRVDENKNNGDNNDNNDNKQKIVRSAWEDDESTPVVQKDNVDSPTMSDEERKKAAFRKKRSNHYNEFHAIKAWKAKQQQQNNDLNE